MEGVILMETIIIVVYKDTINHKYNGDNNGSAQEPNTTSVSGMNINTYAAMEQANINNSNNRK